MRSVACLVAVVVSLFVWLPSCYATDPLTIEPELLKIWYCRYGNGKISLHIKLRLFFRNNSNSPIIVPWLQRIKLWEAFSKPSDVELSRYSKMEKTRKKSKADTADYAALYKCKPDPKYFNIIEPNVSFAMSTGEVDFPPLKRIDQFASTYGKNFVLRVWIETLPNIENAGKDLVSMWSSYGNLQIGKFKSNLITIQLPDNNPEIEPCYLLVD